MCGCAVALAPGLLLKDEQRWRVSGLATSAVNAQVPDEWRCSARSDEIHVCGEVLDHEAAYADPDGHEARDEST